MYNVPLAAIANQKCSLRLDGALFELTLKAGVGKMMLISIARNGQILVQGLRCLPERPLITYQYLEGLEGVGGNFYFVTRSGQYPHYSRFGGDDALLYLTAAELAEQRHG